MAPFLQDAAGTLSCVRVVLNRQNLPQSPCILEGLVEVVHRRPPIGRDRSSQALSLPLPERKLDDPDFERYGIAQLVVVT